MATFSKTDCLSVVGMRGCGKTTLSRRLQSAWPKQVIIDPVREYSDGIVVSNFSEFAEKMQELKRKNSKNFRLIFQFKPGIENKEEIFDAILHVCYEFGHIQIVIEEVQTLTTTGKIPPWLKECLFTGRHKGLSLLFVTQRPGQLNKNILSQCSHVFCGQLHDLNDISYLKNFLKEKSDELPNLPIGKFIYFSPGKRLSYVYSLDKK